MKSGGVTVATPKKPREMLKLIITAFGGGLIGAFVGMFFMRYGVPSSLGALQTQQPQYFDYRPPAPKDLEPMMCTREKPQGTETLPADIIIVATDLFPRRLWGVPEEDLPETPKYLLTFTVGVSQKEGVNEAVKKFSKEWQVLLFHYDGKVSEWDEYEWSRTAIHISTRKQAKWWYAKRFLHPDVVEPYEYIFIWDEDLDLTHFNATLYIDLVKKHGLEISQPALAPDRGLTWQMTKRRGDVEVHKEATEQPGWCTDPHKPPCAGFVEIMAPVFSAKAWRCVWHMIQNDLVHGWGLDFSLQHCVEPAYEKIGVVDAQWIRHKVVPSLGDQGEAQQGRPGWEGVRMRCRYEWSIYTKRWGEAEAKQAKRWGEAEAEQAKRDGLDAPSEPTGSS